MRLFLPVLSLILITACESSQKQTSTAAPLKGPKSLIEQSIEAHGGLDRWKSFGTLAFEMVSQRGDRTSEERSILNLYTRHERITGANYELGYDGKNYWQLLKEEGMKEKNPTFSINLQFYFFAMPFVLADEGVIEEHQGKKELDGKTYEVVKITFESGTGVASDDQYIVYLDPDTKRMEAMLYSVTYFNKENAEKYSALRYTEWQEVNGLSLPKTLTRHRWNEEEQSFGEENGVKHFVNVRLEAEVPAATVFAKPEGAN